jgi:hypothetical protein
MVPKYKLKKRHYLNDRQYAAGAEVDWEGPPSLNMLPANAAAEKAKELYEADRKQRQRTRNSVGWTPTLAANAMRFITQPDPELEGKDGQPRDPMPNINIVGKPKPRRTAVE